ncbi:type VI secretion system Vgr family protein [Sinomicrobium weinanense]|uniref:Gp5/Type VI secretion system Vgr protein OB-fold domain-containing protein n=1 Tax=Sinomicrobium weinanense TaxID=2842200 RepID=A0A926JPH7_9FLAO|nr:phage baseplate assembly protein V [Sinomicrobium weinanense]MBC9795073.1 hypothetical protein [Sinomicrobium weinanense]MBU3123798.1 hypothetical protein [Sinomicrobium weinanense]
MALQTELNIKIGALKINTFKNLSLSQDIDEHHFLILECREDEISLQNPGLKGNYHQLIGETILVSMQGIDRMFSTHSGYFKGIITGVKAQNINDSSGKRLQFKAYSPTILMDNGPESSSFLKKDLVDIVHDTTRLYDQQLLKIKKDPLKLPVYPYVVQYNESDYHFIQRMCSRQGEWFYYNGTELIIGQENTGEEIMLHYGYNLSHYDFEMSLQPTRFKYHSNDLSEGESHQSMTKEYENGVNGIAAELVKSSGRVFSKETIAQHNQLVNEGSGKVDMDNFAQLNFQKKVANMIFVNGSSENPAIRPGAVVRILDEDGSSQGIFKVISATHYCTDTGDYNNNFRAVPVAVEVSPFSRPGEYPRCESQPAVVKENNDPKGLGRIKVQMAWQKENAQTTDWIPLASPHGGSGKGFHFIPEIGENVMVDFQSGNAELPYVTGSVHHNQAKSGYHDPDNNLKAIRSRSGNKMVFDDKAGSTTITDKGSASMEMDGAGTTTITTAAKQLINVGGEEGGPANSSMSMDSDGNVEIKANTKITFIIGESKIEITGTQIKVTSDDILVDGKSQATIKGTDSAQAVFNGIAKIKGSQVDIN